MLGVPFIARTIEITFPESSGLHRVRNFAEELSLTLGNLGDLPMDQADAATTKIVVSKIGKRDVGRCKQLVEGLQKKHLMDSEATIRSSSRASEILTRRRALTVDMIHKISEAWKIPADLMVRPYKLESAP
jgi:hypothetical protein